MRMFLILALAGCAQHARTSLVNAPGDVDLSTPLPNENGDPARIAPASDPGTTSLIIVASPTLLFGNGREGGGKGVIEPGLELHFETHDHAKPWLGPKLGVTVGIGFAQLYEQRSSHVGAMFAEIDVRFPSIKRVVPMDLGVGPAFYADDPQLGGQISVRFPLLTLRARYMERAGFEVWAGYQVPIPFIFSRSK